MATSFKLARPSFDIFILLLVVLGFQTYEAFAKEQDKVKPFSSQLSQCIEVVSGSPGSATSELERLETKFKKKATRSPAIDRILVDTQSYSQRSRLLVLRHLERRTIPENFLLQLLNLFRNHALPNEEYDLSTMISANVAPGEIHDYRITARNPYLFKEVTETERMRMKKKYFIKDRGRFFFEGESGKVFEGDDYVVTEGLNQCRATFVVNLDDGKVWAYHSSTGIGQLDFRSMSKFTRGRKIAFIVGAWPGIAEAEILLKYLNISSQVVAIDNAYSHVSVAYDPHRRRFIINYEAPRKKIKTAIWPLLPEP